MTRTISAGANGALVVSDDPDGILAAALGVALAPWHVADRATALAPDGGGLYGEDAGMARALEREDLPAPFDADPAIDPETAEWWIVFTDTRRTVIRGDELRALVEAAAAVRQPSTAPRTVAMDRFGHFTVSDDPAGAIAEALIVATAPQNADRLAVALAPDGDGLYLETFGGLHRARDRDDLPAPYDRHPGLDPATHELWVLSRDASSEGRAASAVVAGDEMRRLVQEAVELRKRR